jgi:hypothetical protein
MERSRGAEEEAVVASMTPGQMSHRPRWRRLACCSGSSSKIGRQQQREEGRMRIRFLTAITDSFHLFPWAAGLGWNY